MCVTPLDKLSSKFISKIYICIWSWIISAYLCLLLSISIFSPNFFVFLCFLYVFNFFVLYSVYLYIIFCFGDIPFHFFTFILILDYPIPPCSLLLTFFDFQYAAGFLAESFLIFLLHICVLQFLLSFLEFFF